MYNKGNKDPRIERESGKTFLVPVPDRTAETLKVVIVAWIEPGTTVISDCSGAYRDHDTEGYTHRTVNHTTGFVDERTGAHTNTIERTWHHVKAFLSPYKWKGDYIHHNITCSRRGAGQIRWTNSQCSFTSSPQSIGANVQHLQNHKSSSMSTLRKPLCALLLLQPSTGCVCSYIQDR